LRLGFFETWFFRELVRVRDYDELEYSFSFWREKNHEIDFLIQKSNKVVAAIECKTGNNKMSNETFTTFRKTFPTVPIIIVNPDIKNARKNELGVETVTIDEGLDFLRKLQSR